jgi:hypothetical protein
MAPNMHTKFNVTQALNLGYTVVNSDNEADVIMQSTGDAVVDEIFGNLCAPIGKKRVYNIDQLRAIDRGVAK